MHVEGDMSDVKLEIPEDLLCGRAPNEDNTGTTNIPMYQDAGYYLTVHFKIPDCTAVVASVITKYLPQYLAYANSR